MSPIEVLEILEADEYIKNNINIEDNRNMQEAIADDNNLKPKSNIYEKGKNNIINFRDEMEKQILELIGKLPISIDEISMETKINVSDISEKLFMLELDGIVKKISGDRYVLEK
jgi:predicted Rossmann fold nucleotide-binding protein DprA/Smf involved in DNA uptake